ncbi:MAG: glycoside hydrolase family 3 protein, partial [Chlamydiae bacterium]|nr:glycoside hydrolase family 3 protein [Chlamydiota bacterium]
MNNFFIGFLLCCLPSFHLFANKWQDLTLEEKIGQLLIVHFRGESANDISDFFLKNTHVGGFIFYNWSNGLGSRDQVRNLTLSLTEQNKKYSSTPLFFSLDQEGGKVQRLTHEFSSFPSNATLSNLNIPSITYLSGKIQAKELKEVGIHINFSPVVDILCYPNHTTVGDRSYGNSVNKVIAMASNYLKAYSEENVLAVIKHFPGLGGSHIDCHYGTPTCLKSFSQISSLELMPFFYLSSQSDAIMTSHIFLPAIDPIHVASTSKSFIHDLLCQQWKFKGLIISDSLCMEGVILHEGSLHLAARHAILAGTDLLCLGGRILNGDTGKELSHQDILD